MKILSLMITIVIWAPIVFIYAKAGGKTSLEGGSIYVLMMVLGAFVTRSLILKQLTSREGRKILDETENSFESVQDPSETNKIDETRADKKESVWTCRCGTTNPITRSNCSNCQMSKFNVI